MEVDRSAWSGDGDFTIRLLDVLQQIDDVSFVKVEDAPASRAGAGFSFLVNEIYVAFATAPARRVERWLGLLPLPRTVHEPRLSLAELDARLAAFEEVGQADYADDGMLQYLRAERVFPPFQTRGYKLVELVRIYEAGRGPTE
jgi:hypothetical protein